MKKYLIDFSIFLVFLAGLGLLLYPTVSNMINERNQSMVITRYENEIDAFSEEERAAAWKAAQEYNQNLPAVFAAQDSEAIGQSEAYLSTLNLTGSGIMGSLKIDKIRVNLPIYHGTSHEVLQVAVGHLPATSLPVGGESTHAVLSAHTGLPSAKLFTDLDQLEVDDMFYIEVLGEQLVYRIDKITIVEPTDSSELRLFQGKDYVTLVTCTPYGINSHRLLVRGERIYLTEEEAADFFIESDAVFLEKTLLMPIVIVPILIGYFIWILSRPVKKRNPANTSEDAS